MCITQNKLNSLQVSPFEKLEKTYMIAAAGATADHSSKVLLE